MITHSITTPLPGWSEGGWLADPATSGGPLLDQARAQLRLRPLGDRQPGRAGALHGGRQRRRARRRTRWRRCATPTARIAHVECSWAHPAARGFKLAVEIVGTEGRLTWSYDHLMGGVLHPREGDAEWWDALGDRASPAS